MATAAGFTDLSQIDDSECVQPKNKNKDYELVPDEVRKKAFIPNILPEDFLRVVLNEQQITENNDSVLAHRLQYGEPAQQNLGYFRPRVNPVQMSRGALQIDVVEAKLNKNYGFTKMDPYVRIRLANKIYETQTDYNGSKNPKWRKTIKCYLPFNVDTILIEIFDEKSFMDDEMVAFVKYPLPDSLFDGIFLDEWIPLSGKLGEQKEGHINVQFLFTPMENMNFNPYQNVAMPRQPSTGTSGSSTTSSMSPTNQYVVQPRTVQLPPEQIVSITPANTQTISEADIKEIAEMFPTFEADVIKSILETNNGNKETTIEALLQISSDN